MLLFKHCKGHAATRQFKDLNVVANQTMYLLQRTVRMSL